VQIDFRGVQATVAHLYKSPFSRHLIFRFGERDDAQAFLGELTPRITMADFDFATTQDPLLNVGVTFNGLAALGVEPELLTQLDTIYERGPDPLLLGDAPGSRSDPVNWWEGRFKTEEVHCIVHLYVRTEEALEPASTDVRELASRFGLTELIPRRDGTVLDGRSLGHGKLHFGYTDGISHPDISWDDVPDTPTQVNFRNFLLGYASAEHPSAPARGPARDLVRDSCYGVFRWIYQDTATFNRFLSTEGPRLFPDLAPPEAEELLAAKLMGRWRNGAPLVLAPTRDDPELSRRNDFGYASSDPDGRRCPFSAHIRVVNPRDQELDPVAEGVPHVIRRGMPYGPELQSNEDDGQDRGIIGIFLCADIRRQIYTLTGWIRRNDFSPVYDANRRVQDAVIGNRSVQGTSTDFIIPAKGGAVTAKGLPHFVHTKGTVFLLYPAKATLEKLAKTP
jgi:deferrochelatase/peroxidase EfeB